MDLNKIITESIMEAIDPKNPELDRLPGEKEDTIVDKIKSGYYGNTVSDDSQIKEQTARAMKKVAKKVTEPKEEIAEDPSWKEKVIKAGKDHPVIAAATAAGLAAGLGALALRKRLKKTK